MIKTNAYAQTANAYNSLRANKQNEKVKADKTAETKDASKTVKTSESKLSQKAKEYLEKLRNENSDFEFFVADAGDDHQGILKKSTKEFSVMFTSAELEKMASDEEYAKEKLGQVQTAVDMSLKICAQEGFVRLFGQEGTSDSIVNKIGISFNEDGSTNIFAELEKVTEKQSERIEKLKEKRAEEKKAEKKEEKAVKKTVIMASTEEELLKKLQELDWSKVLENDSLQGNRFDFSV